MFCSFNVPVVDTPRNTAEFALLDPVLNWMTGARLHMRGTNPGEAKLIPRKPNFSNAYG